MWRFVVDGLEKPDESEITDVVEHGAESSEDFACPECGEEKFHYYECLECGTIFISEIPPGLRGEAQYGSGIQALALTLTNNVNAAMNKNAMFLAGITNGELTPCEGYIAKLQKRAAGQLQKS